MKRELEYFQIGDSFGGNQDWCFDPMMHLGGCAALTACDICIYLAARKGMTGLYPFDAAHLTKKDYLRFSKIMKPYLRPRSNGVNRTELYTEGFGRYLSDISWTRLSMEEFDGAVNASDAWETIKSQIDDDLPVAYLMLKHKDETLKDFVWHWFLLVGYEEKAPDADFAVVTDFAADADSADDVCGQPAQRKPAGGPAQPKRLVKTATYGEGLWLDFDNLWNTGFEEKGGMVIVRTQ